MANFYQDDFDSKVFGLKVFKLILDENVGVKNELVKTNEKPDLVFCFTKFSRENIIALENLGFSFISIRSSYKYNTYNTKTIEKNLPADLKLIKISEGKPEISEKSLLKMVEVIGSTSRYFADKKIDQKLAKKFYQTWLENSLYNSYADEAFLIINGKEMVGLSTLKVKEDIGYIDLIGVDDNFQGKGLGSVLLSESLKYFEKRGIKDILVITEGENIPANIFYQKNGFTINKIELVYHKHN